MSHSDATRLTNCRACAAPLSDFVTGRCQYCGRVNDLDLRQLDAGQSLGGAAQSRCPRCREALLKLEIQFGVPFELERCKRCLGVFFEVSELERLLRLIASDRSIDQGRLQRLMAEHKEAWPVSYLPCPACAEPMTRTCFGQSPVIIDRCKAHGVWLDGGELGRLLVWARAGGLGEVEASHWESPA
ncbi:MAG: zf-TFIIB domain-containing protein [Vulcanimicrobiota bacterium]